MRKISKYYLLAVFVFSSNNIISGQIQHMGFTDNIYHNVSIDRYYPKMKIISDDIYVASNFGIYKNNLKTNSDWELFAFENIPIIEFVKNGDKILAISTGVKNSTDSSLLLSNDNGKTFINCTSPYFNNEQYNYLHRINQNCQNPNSLLIASESGLFLSTDFGDNWVNINPAWLQWFAAFHPLDTSNIYFTGESNLQQAIIFKSSNNGNTWDKYSGIKGDNCVHNIAFHPHDPNILIFGGEGIIGKSMDKGNTWVISSLHETAMYFYTLIFDENDPNILYASGLNDDLNNDAIYVYRSTDLGETWQLAYNEKVNSDCGGVIDMVKYESKLIFYTEKSGLFELDIEATPSSNDAIISSGYNIEIHQSASGQIQFKSTEKVNFVDVIGLTGKVFKRVSISEQNGYIDTSYLPNGIYFLTFYTDKHPITKKMFITN